MAQMLRMQTIGMRPELEKQLPEDSVTIAALLHDVCKANIYKTVQKWRKDENNRWESYDAYDTDYSRFPVGHGEKSVIMLLRLGLQLTNDEIIAIRWHMGAWNLPMQSYEDKQNISVAYDGCPLADHHTGSRRTHHAYPRNKKKKNHSAWNQKMTIFAVSIRKNIK